MFVYNDITTDARVQRAADTLCKDWDLILLSTDVGKKVDNITYKNVLLRGCKCHHVLNLIACIYQAYKYIKKEKPEVVYAHDYYSTLLIFLLTSKRYCGKIIYDAHELLIPEKDRKMSRREAFFYKFEKKIISKVDSVICASTERGRIMQEHYQLKCTPLIIKNISQLSISSDKETVELIQSLTNFFAQSGPTVVYAGVVTNERSIDKLVDALLSLTPNYKLLIIGDGDALNSLKERASKNPMLISAFTGRIPYKSLGAVLNKCDIGYLFYPTDILNNIYCASNKVYEYASVGLPIISNVNPTIKKLFNESNIGIVTDSIEDGIVKMSSSLDLYKKSCQIFTSENPWSRDASKLRDFVKTI